MKIIPHFGASTIQSIINRDFPAIETQSIRIIENGWDNLVAEVNNNLIFRFPKDKECQFDTEVKVLKILEGKISLQIPRIDYLGKSFTYMGYRKILGNDLTKELYKSLNSDQKDQLVFDLANFLFELHTAVSPEDAIKLGVRKDDLSPYAAAIKSLLGKNVVNTYIKIFAEKTLLEFSDMLTNPFKEVLLHKDVHSNNIAFDKQTEKLNGVFDFGDVIVGDIHIDFSNFFKFGSNFMRKITEKYQEFAGFELNKRRIVIYAYLDSLYDLSKIIEDSLENELYQKTVKRLADWSKNFDIYK